MHKNLLHRVSWKDQSWPSRALRRRTPMSSPPAAGSRSRRSTSRWRSPTCWTCRSTPSTGWSATTPGARASPTPWPRVGPTSTPSPAWRRSSRRSPRSRTSPRRCRCRSATTASRTRSTPSRSARTATSPTPRPLFVTAEFMNNDTGEIKSQTVFMGDFPLMTDKGTFIINGTERVVVSPARPLARASTSSRPPTRPPTRTSSPAR